MPTDIRYLDLTLPTPAQNLACDEALLNDCEANGGSGLLRFWESPSCFIVVGYANKVAEETRLNECEKSAVPILRRCTGGGSVVQGPGCLNYSLILPIAAVADVPATITGTNRFVMERNRAACQSLVGRRVEVGGHTDLVVDGRKFSGNSQRRRREWFLFHGTFLYHFDLSLLERWLRPPPRQPEYRQHRSHAEFVTQLPVSAEEIKQALRKAWQAKEPFNESVLPRIELEITRLTRERYDRVEWNRKW
jgi:lipoate-protein ligase A